MVEEVVETEDVGLGNPKLKGMNKDQLLARAKSKSMKGIDMKPIQLPYGLEVRTPIGD